MDADFDLDDFSDDKQLILGAFIRQLLDGKIRQTQNTQPWMQAVRQYDVFGSIHETNMIQFPIGYIAAILSDFEYLGPANLNTWYQNLLTYAATVHSRKD